MKNMREMQAEVNFLRHTKTRYPAFLDKPELYGFDPSKFENIPKLAKAVKDQALINSAYTNRERALRL